MDSNYRTAFLLQKSLNHDYGSVQNGNKKDKNYVLQNINKKRSALTDPDELMKTNEWQDTFEEERLKRLIQTKEKQRFMMDEDIKKFRNKSQEQDKRSSFYCEQKDMERAHHYLNLANGARQVLKGILKQREYLSDEIKYLRVKLDRLIQRRE